MTQYSQLLTIFCLSSLGNLLLSEAFIVSPMGNGISTIKASTMTQTQLLAKKKRRRRKETTKPDAEKSPSSDSLADFDLKDDSLPDFDLDEDDEPSEPKSKTPAMTEISYDEITDVMMGDSSKPTSSLSDLIADRSLESKFEFDDGAVDNSIPDFPELAAASTSNRASVSASASVSDEEPVPGKKKARQAERRAAAIQARVEEEESKLDLPFIQDEAGNPSVIKTLEAGAWLGIFILIGWEVFINSPFFERSAPMAPVVFELYM